MSKITIKNKIYDTARYVIEEMGNDTIKDYKGIRSSGLRCYYELSVDGVIDLNAGSSNKPEYVIITTAVLYTVLPMFRTYLLKQAIESATSSLFATHTMSVAKTPRKCTRKAEPL